MMRAASRLTGESPLVVPQLIKQNAGRFGNIAKLYLTLLAGANDVPVINPRKRAPRLPCPFPL
jgi:hypothetical protein